MFGASPEQLLAELQEAFNALEAFVAAYDPISVLSQLTLAYLFVPENEFQDEDSDVVTWQRRIEFLTAFVLVRPFLSEMPKADAIVLDQAEKLLERYFKAIERQLLFEAARPREISEKEMLLTEAKIASLYVRGDAYAHHFYGFARDLYGPHDDWFRQRYGFTIAEGVTLAEAIASECAERFNRSLNEARAEARRKISELIPGCQATEDQRSDLESRVGCALHFGRAEDLLAFTREELSAYSGIPKQTCQCFLARMSQEFGHRNLSFPVSFTDPATAPWDYNTLNERPIVRRDEKYWLFVPPLLRSALFSTFYFDLLKDELYRPVFEKARGSWVEKKTAECLRRVFHPEMTLPNPCYPDGTEMADVVVLHDHKILLFQCKSKTLTRPARIGADFDVLRDDMRKAVADAYKQGTRARDYLLATREAKFSVTGKAFAIDMAEVNGIYLVCVTSMPLQALAARLANNNSALGLFPKNEYPWSLSLGDLDVITQVLTSPAQFLHYVLRRQRVEETPFRINADEMDLLGFYLSHGLRFDLEEFVGMDDVGLSGMSHDVDRWVYERFELGHQIDPPRPDMPDEFSDFLRDIEATSDDYRTDCAISLLELSSPGRKRFMDMVARTKERSRQDMGLHSFSAVLKDGERGLSFLSLDANKDRLQLLRQAAAFALMKKYESKCNVWTGFGWDIASTRAVDVAFFISQAWTADAQMDRLVKEKLRRGHRGEM
jgi:hypothetical protein